MNEGTNEKNKGRRGGLFANNEMKRRDRTLTTWHLMFFQKRKQSRFSTKRERKAR